MGELLAEAEKKYVLNIDAAKLDEAIACAQAAQRAHVSAQSMAGKVPDSTQADGNYKIMQRAALTAFEIRLLKAFAATQEVPPMGRPGRSLVQGWIKQLREQRLHEKECLFAAMYRYSYECLTKK